MTLGEKLAKLRKENNITQEQLASELGVSRQAISKWESDVSFPETDKLIRMSELYDCSLDYLLKESVETRESGEPKAAESEANALQNAPQNAPQSEEFVLSIGSLRIRERKSQRTWRGLPLWQIGKNAKAVVAVGLNAKGILAIGLMARGVFSIGLLSLGLVSLGVLSLGLLAFGTLAIGILAVAAIAVGIAAIGGIALGCFALGGVGVGFCSVGALAIGKYVALGDYAYAEVALGKSKAVGTLLEKLGRLSAEELESVMNLLDERVPVYLGWAKEIVKLILRILN